jgi:hypothetical protein
MASQADIERNARVFARNGFMCVYCDYHANTYDKWRSLTIDHFIPLAKDGTWAEENLVTACMDCNCIKKDEVFASISEARAKFATLYLPIERRNFEKYFAPLIVNQSSSSVA